MMNYNKEPLLIEIPVPNGNYEICVTVKAHGDTVFSLLSQSRRFMAQDVEIKKGCETDITFTANVCDFHKHGEEYTPVNSAQIYILCDGDITVTAAASPVDVPTIYIAGDSTVTDQPAEYPYVPSETYCGWGQMFPQFLENGIAVSNHAQSGSTTKDFMNTNWTAFKDKLKTGDYFIIEFGHNDQKDETLDAFGGYSDNLRYYINFAREHGATPILCSPINRIIFQEDGKLLNILGEYRNAVKAVSEEMNVPFIDLWSRTTEYFETAGPVKSWNFLRCKGEARDYTHTNDIGGNLIARFVAQEMIKQNVKIAEFIRKDKIKTEFVYADKGDKVENTEQLSHLRTLGLINNIPAADLIDIDDDITKI